MMTNCNGQKFDEGYLASVIDVFLGNFIVLLGKMIHSTLFDSVLQF
jgi:hypothetical protein